MFYTARSIRKITLGYGQFHDVKMKIRRFVRQFKDFLQEKKTGKLWMNDTQLLNGKQR